MLRKWLSMAHNKKINENSRHTANVVYWLKNNSYQKIINGWTKPAPALNLLQSINEARVCALPKFEKLMGIDITRNFSVSWLFSLRNLYVRLFLFTQSRYFRKINLTLSRNKFHISFHGIKFNNYLSVIIIHICNFCTAFHFENLSLVFKTEIITCVFFSKQFKWWFYITIAVFIR